MANHEDEEFVRKLLRRKNRGEALAWLTGAPAGVHRGLGELAVAESVEAVRQLYKIGISELVVVEVGTSPDGHFHRSRSCEKPSSSERVLA